MQVVATESWSNLRFHETDRREEIAAKDQEHAEEVHSAMS